MLGLRVEADGQLGQERRDEARGLSRDNADKSQQKKLLSSSCVPGWKQPMVGRLVKPKKTKERLLQAQLAISCLSHVSRAHVHASPCTSSFACEREPLSSLLPGCFLEPAVSIFCL